MEEYAHFSISPLSDTESSLINKQGQRIARIRGIVLEKAFCIDSGRFLVVTTDDCPYEEGFHVSLIDEDGSLLETTHRVIPYTPGIVTAVYAENSDTIKIALHDGETIRITLIPEGTRNPARYIQKGFRSSNGIFGKHYLQVDSTSESAVQQKREFL